MQEFYKKLAAKLNNEAGVRAPPPAPIKEPPSLPVRTKDPRPKVKSRKYVPLVPHCRVPRIGDTGYYLQEIAKVTGFSEEEIISHSRIRELVKVRAILYWLLRTRTKMSFPQIAHRLGGRDHTTVMNSYWKMELAVKGQGVNTDIPVPELIESLYNLKIWVSLSRPTARRHALQAAAQH